MDATDDVKADTRSRGGRPPRVEIDLGMHGRVLDALNALLSGAVIGSVGLFLVQLSLWLGAWFEAEPDFGAASARVVFNATSAGEAESGFAATLLPFAAVCAVACILRFGISTLRSTYYASKVYEIAIKEGKGLVNDNQRDVANGASRAETGPRKYWSFTAAITYGLAGASLNASLVFLTVDLHLAAAVGAAVTVAVAACGVLIFSRLRVLTRLLKGVGPKIHRVNPPSRPEGLRDVPDSDSDHLPAGIRILRFAHRMSVVMLSLVFLSYLVFGIFMSLVDEYGSPTGTSVVDVYDTIGEPSAAVMGVHLVIVHAPWVSSALMMFFAPFAFLYRSVSRAHAVRILKPLMERDDVDTTYPKAALSSAALSLNSGTRCITGMAGAVGSVLIVIAVSPVPGWEAVSGLVPLVFAAVMMVVAATVDAVAEPRYRDTRNRILAAWPSASTIVPLRYTNAGWRRGRE